MTALRPLRPVTVAAPLGARLAALVATLVVLLGLVGVAPAGAHSALTSSTPSAGSTVATPPSELLLVFNEAVTLGDEPVRLFDAKGERLEVGEVERPDGDMKRVAVEVLDELADGTYVVAWRATSADSHPINGAFTFAVGTPTSGVDTGSLVTGLLQDRGSPVVAWTLSILRWLVYAFVSLAVGGWIVARWVWPEGAPLVRTRRGISAAATGVVVASALAIAAQGAYSAGEGFASLFDPSLWIDVLGTRFGQAAVIRIAGAGLLLIGVSLALRRAARDVVCWTASGVVVVGVILSNHATTGRWVPLALAADALHVAAMCAWLGGLVALVVWILPQPEPEPDDETDRLAHADDVGLAASRRFSNLAALSVAALVVSGVLQSIRQVGDWDALTTTTYGRVLIAKVGVVVVLVAVAFSSRWLVNRWRASDEPGGGGARAVLRRSVAAEVVLAVGVLGASTALSNAIPAIDAVALPFQQSVANAQGIAEFYIDPARVGDTELHVIVTDIDGSVPQIDDMSVTLELPEREVGPIDVEMRRYQGLPNDYWAPAATFPFPGTWKVEARARIGEFEQKVFSVDVTVR